jgi:hypothetical protein
MYCLFDFNFGIVSELEAKGFICIDLANLKFNCFFQAKSTKVVSDCVALGAPCFDLDVASSYLGDASEEVKV